MLVSQIGSQSSFTMSRLNVNWKILGEILVGQMGGEYLSTDPHTPQWLYKSRSARLRATKNV